MVATKKYQEGFTLLELVTVLILVGIIGVIAVTRSIPSSTFQLQTSRDTIVAALFSAQQRAMTQVDSVRFIAGTNQIDIRQDTNDDGSFSASESIRVGSVQYPVVLPVNQSLTASIFDYDRLGRTTATTLNLNQDSATVAINVTASGYSF